MLFQVKFYKRNKKARDKDGKRVKTKIQLGREKKREIGKDIQDIERKTKKKKNEVKRERETKRAKEIDRE